MWIIGQNYIKKKYVSKCYEFEKIHFTDNNMLSAYPTFYEVSKTILKCLQRILKF